MDRGQEQVSNQDRNGQEQGVFPMDRASGQGCKDKQFLSCATDAVRAGCANRQNTVYGNASGVACWGLPHMFTATFLF